jgi:hypothetical protein
MQAANSADMPLPNNLNHTEDTPMMMIDERASRDPWVDWKPRWTGKQQTPHDIQEKHSPTAKQSGLSGADQSQRRIVDTRLWEGMTESQQNAAIEIADSFDMMKQGLGYVTSDWQRIPGCRGPSNIAEAHARMMNFYMEWAKKCAGRKISHAMMVDVLCWGFPCGLIDRDRRLKNGSTRANLMKGLSLYCELRGWG